MHVVSLELPETPKYPYEMWVLVQIVYYTVWDCSTVQASTHSIMSQILRRLLNRTEQRKHTLRVCHNEEMANAETARQAHDGTEW